MSPDTKKWLGCGSRSKPFSLITWAGAPRESCATTIAVATPRCLFALVRVGAQYWYHVVPLCPTFRMKTVFPDDSPKEALAVHMIITINKIPLWLMRLRPRTQLRLALCLDLLMSGPITPTMILRWCIGPTQLVWEVITEFDPLTTGSHWIASEFDPLATGFHSRRVELFFVKTWSRIGSSIPILTY